MECPTCGTKHEVKDRYVKGDEEPKGEFRAPCDTCGCNENDEDEMPCRWCSHSPYHC